MYPLKKQSLIIHSLEGKKYLQKYSIYDLAIKIASEEPQIFSDSSNPYANHVSIFHKHFNQIEKSKSPNVQIICNGSSHKDLIQYQIIYKNFQYIFLQLKNGIDQNLIAYFKEDSINKAQAEIVKEESKMNQFINDIINVQMEKIQQKIDFQKNMKHLYKMKKHLRIITIIKLAERLIVVQQKLQMYIEENNQ